MIITAGSTNKSVYVYIVQDASATNPGEPVTGLLFSDIETGGSAGYTRQGAEITDFTLITLASASASHADGGFVLVDDTTAPGWYRCDLPDAAFAAGVDQVMLNIVVASGKNALALPLTIDLTVVDLRDGVRGGMTALPNAAADAAGGLPISDAGGLDMDDIPLTAEFEARTIESADYFDPATDTVANVATVDTTTANTDMRGTDDANTVVPDEAGVAPTAVENRQEMDTNSTGLNTLISGQVTINDNVLLIPTTEMRGTDNAATASALATVDTVVDAIKLVTENLPDAGALTSIAQAAALATVDTVVDAVKDKTDKLTFTSGNDLDANIKKVNSVTVTGTGSPGNEWGP